MFTRKTEAKILCGEKFRASDCDKIRSSLLRKFRGTFSIDLNCSCTIEDAAVVCPKPMARVVQRKTRWREGKD
jgi:hypothetical protein